MTSRKGGYIIIDLTSTTLVDDLFKALSFGKPVLVYNANNEANFYTLSYDDDNDLYILNGAKDSFSVDDDGDITPISYDKHLYQHIIKFNSYNPTLSIFKDNNTILTINDVIEYLTSIGYGLSDSYRYVLGNAHGMGGVNQISIKVSGSSSNKKLEIYIYDTSDGNSFVDVTTITDTINTIF